MILKLHENNPSEKRIERIVETLENDGVIIYPTDTVYAFGCSIDSQKAADRITRIKGDEKKRDDFSLVFKDISQIAEYTKPIPNDIFKIMKDNLPGPFTFLLEANHKVPKLYKNKKRIIGARIPHNNIALHIVERLGKPMLTSSVHDEDSIIDYTTDPELIHERYHKLVDYVADGGPGDNEASTVVDCRDDAIEVVRQGKGVI
ncbi:MAG: threonylcarbamoyl-AMP synthase [Bacteroidales bacterium]|nr:threonylcarbamoyl-AMP synthase [Bacteroidales bacterium]MCF8333029.1 threonylcarbamoyl-AMP synthase [Bacteroidales bacterium]